MSQLFSVDTDQSADWSRQTTLGPLISTCGRSQPCKVVDKSSVTCHVNSDSHSSRFPDQLTTIESRRPHVSMTQSENSFYESNFYFFNSYKFTHKIYSQMSRTILTTILDWQNYSTRCANATAFIKRWLLRQATAEQDHTPQPLL